MILEYPCGTNLKCEDCEHFQLCQKIGIHAGEFRDAKHDPIRELLFFTINLNTSHLLPTSILEKT